MEVVNSKIFVGGGGEWGVLISIPQTFVVSLFNMANYQILVERR